MYIYFYIYIHVYIYIYICIYPCTYTCKYLCAYIYTCKHIYMYLNLLTYGMGPVQSPSTHFLPIPFNQLVAGEPDLLQMGGVSPFPYGKHRHIYIAIYLVVFCFYISVFTTFIRSPKFSHYDRQISRFLPHAVTHWRS